MTLEMKKEKLNGHCRNAKILRDYTSNYMPIKWTIWKKSTNS